MQTSARYNKGDGPLGGKMPIKLLPNGKTHLTYNYRKPGAKHGTNRRKTINSQDTTVIAREWAKLTYNGPEQTSSSLTTFAECIDLAVAHNGGAGMDSVYKILQQTLGKNLVDKTFSYHFDKFIRELKETKASNTVANYISATKTTLKRSYKAGLIPEIPVLNDEIKREFRSRIWTPKERIKIYAQLDTDENLYWILRLAEKNPIRKMDIVNLKRDNLVLEGRYAPYIKYQPRKTKSRKPKPAILRELDDELLWRFQDVSERFPDCPYLFPRILKDKRRGTENWKYQGNIRKRFTTVCEDAGVEDFVFHDMKHVAITFMLTRHTEDGQRVYSRESLKKLGIQFSERAIDVYDQSGSFDELDRIERVLSSNKPVVQEKLHSGWSLRATGGV